MSHSSRIYYIGFYGAAQTGLDDRKYSPAAAGKMEYVSSLIMRSGYPVDVVSLSPTLRLTGAASKVIVLPNELTVRLPASLGPSNKLARYIDSKLIKFWLMSKLLFTIPPGSTLVVYHSLEYGAILRKLKMLKRYRLIMEVEEIYQQAVSCTRRVQRSEWAAFRAADGYIFSTGLLESQVNFAGRPSMILHGDYRPQSGDAEKLGDGRTHVVYAGTLDRRKGGAIRALLSALYLPPHFHVHILGHGSREERDEIGELVGRVANIGRHGRCAKVSFDGRMEGPKLKAFLSSCDIGLSTQDASASFNDSSFPSKILVYLSHGLRVVSCRIGAVEGSAVSDSVTFYDGDAPRAVAKAIRRSLEASGVDAKTLLQGLDRRATQDMARLISETGGELPEQDGS